MFFFRKYAAVVLALGCGAIFAGTMGTVCDGVYATTPCEGTSWDFGARALFLDPVYSDGDYRYAAVENSSGKYTNFNQKRGWGFFIEGSYHYNTGSDVNLNVYHLEKSMQKIYQGNFYFLNAREAELGLSQIKPSWNALNLEFGQYVSLGENKNIRFHGGLQYARLTVDKNVSGINTDGFYDGLNFNMKTKSTFNGLGPRVGAHLGYDVGYHVGLYSDFAAAVLAGYDKINNNFQDSTGIVFLNKASKTAVVPELEAKLGIQYDYGMAMGDLTFDLGCGLIILMQRKLYQTISLRKKRLKFMSEILDFKVCSLACIG